MDVRRLKELPDIPLSYDLIAERGFTFKLDGKEIYHALLNPKQARRLRKRLPILQNLFLYDIQEDKVREIISDVEKSLDPDAYKEIINILCFHLSPYKLVRHTLPLPPRLRAVFNFLSPLLAWLLGFRSFIVKLDTNTVFDLTLMIIFANQVIKKKVRDIIKKPATQESLEAWMSGLKTEYFKRRQIGTTIGQRLGLN